VNPLEWGARRRQNELERRAQDAFLAEIAENWQPSTAQQRRLGWRSSLTHLRERVLGGGPTMAAVAVASVPTAIGSILLTVAPAAHRVAYREPSTDWASVLLTLGLFGLIFEFFRSPRTVHLRRFSLLAGLPLAIGGIWGAATLHWHYDADRILASALVVVALGMAAIVFTNLLGRRPLRRVVHLALRVTATGCLLTACGDYPWGLMYLRDHDNAAAAGSFFAAAGALLIAIAIFRSQPDVSP
jgi:hypothetical protein